MTAGVITGRLSLELAAFLLGVLLVAWPAVGESEVRVEVTVIAEATGKPIEGAAIYLRFKVERFLRKDKQTEWKSKTNQDGKAAFPPVPEGLVLVQVVAKGWKTYGEHHTLQGPKHTLEIKLKPPKKWY